jgi:hypothetical protein
MIWFYAIVFIIIALCIAVVRTDTDQLGGGILFILCVLGIFSGVWFIMIPSFLFMIGLLANIFGD